MVVGTVAYSKSPQEGRCVGPQQVREVERTAENFFKVVIAFLAVTVLTAVPVVCMLAKAPSGHLCRVALFAFTVWATQFIASLRTVMGCLIDPGLRVHPRLGVGIGTWSGASTPSLGQFVLGSEGVPTPPAVHIWI